jgi:hypothetical protein
MFCSKITSVKGILVSDSQTISLIPQKNSWGQFTISVDMFRDILTAHRVFVPFLDFVHAFGSKSHEDHHNWNGFRYNLPLRPPNEIQVYGKLFKVYSLLTY